MVSTKMRDTDRYIITVGGQWDRYSDNKDEAVKYARLAGDAVVYDMVTGEKVAAYR